MCAVCACAGSSVDVASNLCLEVHVQDSSGCRCIWLFYNQDAYNQGGIYVADVGVPGPHHNTNKNSWAGVEGPRARARHWVRHLKRKVSFHPHHKPCKVRATPLPVLSKRKLRHGTVRSLTQETGAWVPAAVGGRAHFPRCP